MLSFWFMSIAGGGEEMAGLPRKARGVEARRATRLLTGLCTSGMGDFCVSTANLWHSFIQLSPTPLSIFPLFVLTVNLVFGQRRLGMQNLGMKGMDVTKEHFYLFQQMLWDQRKSGLWLPFPLAFIPTFPKDAVSAGSICLLLCVPSFLQ